MADIITVIAYKENAVESCRSCVMGRYDSDLSVFSSDSVNHVVEFLVNLETDNMGSYSGYDYIYLVNGRCIDYGDCRPSEDLDALDYEEEQKLETVIYGIKARVKEQMTKVRQELVEAKERQERERLEANERSRKANEIAELKRLRAAYPEVK